MIAWKHIGAVVIALTVAAVFLLGVFYSNASDMDKTVSFAYSYEGGMFDTDTVMCVNIVIPADDWQDLLNTATSENYYKCDVLINGETCNNVGIRAKGNTSLSSVASSDSDRYSLKINFDEYVSGQTFQGLDKLVLNNNYSDATMMKEAIVYDMFAFLGANASLYNYAAVYVNGEYMGVYLALEAVEESFALRNFGVGYGELYKPDSMEMGGAGKMQGIGMSEIMDKFGINDNNTDNTRPDMQQHAGTTDSAATLNYIDDDLDSYSIIWDSEVFNSSKKDHRRVVTALKNISEGNSIDKYMDVDNMLRYLAVHTFSVNLDSLSGNMAHNYYLYEEDGALNMIPWDYNLAFGGFQSSSASETINFPIDTPFSSDIDASRRKFFTALLENEEYNAKYHEYLALLADEYVCGGGFESTYTRIRTQIDTLVKTDPTAFYSYDEYEAALDMLVNVISLRAQSVKGQLDGTVPSTQNAQALDKSALVDTTDINLSVMGAVFGGGRNQNNTKAPNTPDNTDNAQNTAQPQTTPVPSATPSDASSGARGDGEMQPPPYTFDPSSQGGGFPGGGGMQPPSGTFDPNAQGGGFPGGGGMQPPPYTFDPNAQGSGFPNNQGGSSYNTSGNTSTVIVYVICFVAMVAACVFAAKYKRR